MELPTTYQSCTSQLVEKAQTAQSDFKPLNGTAQSLGSERGQSARESASRVVPRLPGVRLARPSLASGRVGAPGPVGTSNRLGVQPSGKLVITALLSWLNIPVKSSYFVRFVAEETTRLLDRAIPCMIGTVSVTFGTCGAIGPPNLGCFLLGCCCPANHKVI